jgi:hypothetical protein
MRTIFKIWFLFVLISTEISAQEYHPALGDTNVWKIVSTFESTLTETYSTKRDTVFNGRYYKEFGLSYFLNVFGYIREDSIAKKIYIRPTENHQDTNEYVMYDFSLEVNDSIELFNIDSWQLVSLGLYTVDSIKLIYIDGIERKKFFLTGEPYVYPGRNENPVWIEGIGSIGHFLYPGISVDEMNLGELSCFFKDNKHIYQSPKFNSCDIFIIGINETKNKNSFEIYPNPFNNNLTIKFNYANKTNIRIINNMGQIVYLKKSIIIDNLDLDLSFLEDNLYILQIFNNEMYETQKIIKKTKR